MIIPNILIKNKGFSFKKYINIKIFFPINGIISIFLLHCFFLSAAQRQDELDITISVGSFNFESLRIAPRINPKPYLFENLSVEDREHGISVGDLVVQVNGEPLTTEGIEESINILYLKRKGKRLESKRETLLYPLVFHNDESTHLQAAREGFLVGAFLRLEIVQAQNITFRPAGKHREELVQLREAEIMAEQVRLAGEMEEKRRKAEALALEEKQKKEQAQQRVKQKEMELQKRIQGEGFSFDAILLEEDIDGLGIFFAEDTPLPIVASINETSKGFSEGIRKGDVLTSVNGIDVSTKSLADIVDTIRDAEFPKIFVFQVFARGEEVRVQSQFEFYVSSPAILSGQLPVQKPQSWGGNITAFDPCEPVSVKFVSPRTGCKKVEFTADKEGVLPSILFAVRGECPFVDKVKTMKEAGAQMVVVVNTDDTLIDMPAGKISTDGITTPLAMISKTNGSAIEKVLEMGHTVKAALAPQHMCNWKSNRLGQQNKPTRATGDSGGGLHVISATLATVFDFSDALFGPLVKDNDILPFIIANPADGCSVEGYTVRIFGSFVAIDRGGCSFAQKVIIAQKLGAVAVVILNNEVGGSFRLMTSPDEEALITIPTVMISQAAAQEIKKTVGRGETMLARFEHTSFVGEFG